MMTMYMEKLTLNIFNTVVIKNQYYPKIKQNEGTFNAGIMVD